MTAAEIVHDLQTRLAGAEHELATARTKRRPFVFRASQGDAEAIAKLDAMTRSEEEAKRSVQDLTDALGEAKKLAVTEREKAAVAMDKHLLAEAQEMAENLFALDAEFDAALVNLRSLFDQRQELTTALAMSPCLPPIYRNRLHDESRINVAFRTARANGIYTGRHHDTPANETLEQMDRQTLANLQLPQKWRSPW